MKHKTDQLLEKAQDSIDASILLSNANMRSITLSADAVAELTDRAQEFLSEAKRYLARAEAE